MKTNGNPLRRRYLRELRGELGKYLVVFLLLTASIGFVSGFLVADGSMIAAYEEGFTKYNIEDGNFRTAEPLNKAQKKLIGQMGVQLYDLFYTEQPLTNGSTLRIFAQRQEVDLVCLMAGAWPAAPGEIAIDRMYADNNGLTVGDTLQSGSRSWAVTGLVALSDYSCLFSNNSDAMFDAVKFGVAIVTPEAFAAFDEDEVVSQYAWKYDAPPADEEAERQMADDFLEQLNREAALDSFIPRYQNQAIRFTGDDMGSDKAMMTVLLYMLIAILAFVFAVTTGNTILKEANVIGTLRASGYTRGELVRHYMAMPMLVTLAGAAAGNLLGYTAVKDVCAGMYYGSYSLPTYVTIWSAEAFWKTTAVPVAMMALVNFWMLYTKLRLPPLQFLRRDLSRGRRRRAIPLPPLPFFSRFRLRVILQNMGGYLVLLVGILFANLLLMFGLGLPMVLDAYQSNMEQNLLCGYQYLLTMPVSLQRDDHKLESLFALLAFTREVETDNPDAEKFSAYTLKTIPGAAREEEVLLYGIQPASRYLTLEIPQGTVLLSSAYADKFLLEAGDTITLRENYEDTLYTFTVGGVYQYDGALAVFMPQAQLNETFDLGEDYFCGYLSDTPITDIDAAYIGSVIDLDALTKISRQLNVSMGSMAYLVDGFALVIFVVLIYLLSKLIIERNAHAISMAKILGYTNAEIARLYIVSTSAVVVLCMAGSLPAVEYALRWIFRVMLMSEMTGWIPFDLDPSLYPTMLGLGLGTYAVVAALEYRRVRRVPMDAALKYVE